jgi:intracellular multiplication protein IcmL
LELVVLSNKLAILFKGVTMADDALRTVALRNDFYRDNYHRVLMVFLISLVLNLGLGSLLYYLMTHPPAPKYFATSIDGRITPLVPMDQKNQSDAELLQWANTAAVAAFTYDFVNYREQLQAGSEFFTADGWNSFLQALQNSRTLDTVKANRLNVSAVPTSAPTITQQGALRIGAYGWRVQVPLQVTFQGGASYFSTKNYVVTMLIQRVPSLNSPRGIGITSFVTQEVGGG